LSCTSRGSPPDTFTWRKDSGPIEQSTNIARLTYTSSLAVFRADYSINNVTTSDSGAYTCTVTNPIGSDSETITVNVSGELCKYQLKVGKVLPQLNPLKVCKTPPWVKSHLFHLLDAVLY